MDRGAFDGGRGKLAGALSVPTNPSASKTQDCEAHHNHHNHYIQNGPDAARHGDEVIDEPQRDADQDRRNDDVD